MLENCVEHRKTSVKMSKICKHDFCVDNVLNI